jgi:S1-C subfamily serine protease
MAGLASGSCLWPESYGFYIYGSGPTFVIYVEPASVSDMAGIHAGDRIVEIDNQDVSKLSSNVIKYVAKNSKQNPPAVSVQSAQKAIDLIPDYKLNRINFFGFTVKGHGLFLNNNNNEITLNNIPVLIDQIVEGSQAFNAGLRPGDIIIEVNNKRVKSCETVMSFLNVNKNISLKYIPMSTQSTAALFGEVLKSANSKHDNPPCDPKIKRAKKFYSIVGNF